jgi:hypothetical protein
MSEGVASGWLGELTEFSSAASAGESDSEVLLSGAEAGWTGSAGGAGAGSGAAAGAGAYDGGCCGG